LALNTLRNIAVHPVARERPISALVRILVWQIQSRLWKVIVRPWIAPASLVVQKGMTGATGNIYFGLHEFPEMMFTLHMLREGELFLDVGANVGSYSVLAASVCGASVVAVEPDPDTAAHLDRNMRQNRVSARVQIVQAAVGAEGGVARFTVGKDTENRLVRDEETGGREVEVRTIDDIVGDLSPTMLKIDVEGFETAAMRGAARTLDNPVLRAILTEGQDPELVRQLEAAGFVKRFYDPFSRTLKQAPSIPQANSLYLRDTVHVQERVACARPVRVLHRTI
jgi:FkbM family methyltransferase